MIGGTEIGPLGGDGVAQLRAHSLEEYVRNSPGCETKQGITEALSKDLGRTSKEQKLILGVLGNQKKKKFDFKMLLLYKIYIYAFFLTLF